MRSLNKKTIIATIAMFSLAWQANAQATVGNNEDPKPFSLLQVSTAQKAGGLRMAQLSEADRNTLTTAAFQADAQAAGLVIYNTTFNKLEYWNATKKQWIQWPQ